MLDFVVALQKTGIVICSFLLVYVFAVMLQIE